jgi:predicted ferric reductase
VLTAKETYTLATPSSNAYQYGDPTEMTLLDLCSYLGLGAVGAVTVNLLLGMLMSLRYSPVRHWRHLHINLFALHQWTAYIAVFFTLSHPVLLLFLHTPYFGWLDVLWPVHSYLQPKLNLAGAGALYLIVLVVVSSLPRTQIGRPLWRGPHYLVFPSAVLLFLHSILADPNLKDGHPDLLDGGKAFIEISLLISVAATGIRIRLRGRGFRRE